MAKAAGPLHKVSPDIRKVLGANAEARAAWDDITALARNEWICWVTSAKQDETRAKRVKRLAEDLAKGKRRPCCWPGCPHRRPSARKWFR